MVQLIVIIAERLNFLFDKRYTYRNSAHTAATTYICTVSDLHWVSGSIRVRCEALLWQPSARHTRLARCRAAVTDRVFVHHNCTLYQHTHTNARMEERERTAFSSIMDRLDERGRTALCAFGLGAAFSAGLAMALLTKYALTSTTQATEIQF